MKKLPWIIMGLLFLSGIGMIAWSLFPMPVKLISGKLTGEKRKKRRRKPVQMFRNPMSSKFRRMEPPSLSRNQQKILTERGM